MTPKRNQGQREQGWGRTAMRRLGLVLTKSNRRDDLAPDFGLFALLHPETGGGHQPEAGLDRFVHSWTLDQVEDFLEKAKRRSRIISPANASPIGATITALSPPPPSH